MQRQRPPVAAGLGDVAVVVDDGAITRAARRSTAGGTSTAPRPAGLARAGAARSAASARSCVPAIMSQREPVGRPPPRRRRRSRVVGDLARRLGVVPAELGGDQLGDRRRGLDASRHGRTGGPGCAATARRRASSPSRGARRRPPRPARTAARARAARRATGRRRSSASTAPASDAEAVAEVGVGGAGGRLAVAVGAEQAQPLRAAAGPCGRAARATSSTVSSAISRYVVSLPPVMAITPPAPVVTRCRRDRSAVRPLSADFDERAQPGPHAGDVVGA